MKLTQTCAYFSDKLFIMSIMICFILTVQCASAQTTLVSTPVDKKKSPAAPQLRATAPAQQAPPPDKTKSPSAHTAETAPAGGKPKSPDPNSLSLPQSK